jgi:hypothetical protein
MKSLNENLKNLDVKALFKHPRLKMLDEFHRRINAERRAVDMKELPIRAIAIKIAHLSVEDLAFLLKKCSQNANFSRCFFGSLKVKKDLTDTTPHA